MDGNIREYFLTKTQSFLLVIFSFLMASLLFYFRISFSDESSLDQLARRSLTPEAALSNGLPTIFEFYADWCEVCREMGPAMLSLEKNNSDKLNVVMLNVDNGRWEDLLDKYQVKGIPQMNFFDAKGKLLGKSIGLRTNEELEKLLPYLYKGKALPELVGITSKLNINYQ